MDSTQYVKYIEDGLGIRPEKRQFRKLALGPGLLVLLGGVMPCVVLGGRWLILLSIMLGSSIVMTSMVFVVSLKPLTIKSRLKMQALIYSNWVVQILLLQTMLWLLAYGINFLLVLMYIPTLVTPFVLGLKNAKYLKFNHLISKKKNSILFLPLGCSGVIGASLAKIFLPELTNEIAILFVIVVLSVLGCVLSVGLLAYQRIYYLKKYTDY